MQFTVWPQVHSKVPMTLTAEQEKSFSESDKCHICGVVFNLQTVNGQLRIDNKVRDHRHLTGAYRGAAHPICNLKYQDSKTLPVVFHNLDYDSHFLIECVANRIPGKTTIIPKNSEHYISFTKTLNNIESDVIEFVVTDNDNKILKFRERPRIRFIDSYRFLACALSKLAAALTEKKTVDKLTISREVWSQSLTKKTGGIITDDDITLLAKKGIYPYDFMDSPEKLDSTELPKHEDFYDSLKEGNISADDYDHATEVWKTFEIQKLILT